MTVPGLETAMNHNYCKVSIILRGVIYIKSFYELSRDSFKVIWALQIGVTLIL